MKKPRVAVFGDIMLDRYDYCENRENPESSAPCYRVKKTVFLPGGAGNVAANLSKLGAEVTLFGLVGNDDHGKIVLMELAKFGINKKVLINESIATIVKQRILAVGDGRYHGRLDFGDDTAEVHKILSLAPEIVSALSPVIKNGFDACIVSDYAKGFVSQELMIEIKKLGCPIFVDPKQKKELYVGVELIKPNRRELHVLTSQGSDIERVESLSKELSTDVLFTMGEDGMCYVGRSGERIELPGHHVDVADVTGSGDTVIATYVFYRCLGRSVRESLELANRAGSINVQHVGCYRVSREEIENFSTNQNKNL